MNRCLVILGLIAAVAMQVGAQSETWQLDPAHSAAQFSVQHMGISTVRGAFAKLSGTIQYDPSDVTKSSLDVSIDAASVDSRVEMRDKDLRSDHFLDVQKYPAITFKSKRVEAEGSDKLRVSGDLTIHGVTKDVVLEVTGPSKPMKDPRGKMHMGAEATTTINRMDFGMTGYQGMVGNDVSIILDVEMVKPASAPPATQ